ncbi:hypothetical protein G8A07_15155 [Roseateles sp. DAIF2]|uniref:hypothetical protein n=1 Tax=Roseateles sp. DAIF2 TaxID=2714952 RepID=UPI0018A24CD7|nr:hypothetical protein [Roseateles sp. DAIF2]QPF74119.1 hypothetical protein G8A07_15155 [Roseateles sp. DAIF2]
MQSSDQAPKPRQIPGMTLVSTALVGPACGALITSVDELFQEREPNGVLTWFQAGKMKSIAVEWNACSVTVRQEGSAPKALYLGEGGQLVQFDGQAFLDLPSVSARGLAGPLRSIRTVGARCTLAVGTALQVYRSDDWVDWRSEAIPLLPGVQAVDLGLESLAHFSEDEVYAVGWEGLLCQRSKGEWQRIDSPTNCDLFDIACASDGVAYAVGDQGTVIRGRGSVWTAIEHGDTEEKLWGVACLDGRVFIASMNLLYELVGENLVPVEPPDDEVFPSSVYRLTAAGSTLWSAGMKELFEFDGSRWTPLLSFFGAE